MDIQEILIDLNECKGRILDPLLIKLIKANIGMANEINNLKNENNQLVNRLEILEYQIDNISQQ